MEDVKAGSNKAADREDTPPAMGVCVSLQVTWKDLFTSLKINHKVKRAPLPFLLFLPMPVLHPLCSSEVGQCGLSPQGGSVGQGPCLPPPP